MGRKAGARRALLKSLAMNLVLYERIQTTSAKAKALKPYIERLIRHSLTNSLESRRYLMHYLPTKKSVDKCLEVLGPKFVSKTGGYTRIIPVGIRRGDAGKVSIIEFNI